MVDPEDAPELPAGYRQLEADERIQAGDKLCRHPAGTDEYEFIDAPAQSFGKSAEVYFCPVRMTEEEAERCSQAGVPVPGGY